MKDIILTSLAILSALTSISAFILDIIRYKQDRRKDKEESYRQLLRQAQEKDAHFPPRNERPKR